MPDEVTGVLNLTMSATEKKAISLVASDPEHQQKVNPNFTLEFGDADGKLTKSYGKVGTVPAGNEIEVDLQAAILDTFGESISFTKLKAFAVYNKSDIADPVSTAVMHVGGGTGGVGTDALDGWITSDAADGTEKIVLPAKGLHVWAALQDGITIASMTGSKLRLANTDGGSQVATYQLIFFGT